MKKWKSLIAVFMVFLFVLMPVQVNAEDVDVPADSIETIPEESVPETTDPEATEPETTDPVDPTDPVSGGVMAVIQNAIDDAQAALQSVIDWIWGAWEWVLGIPDWFNSLNLLQQIGLLLAGIVIVIVLSLLTTILVPVFEILGGLLVGFDWLIWVLVGIFTGSFFF